MYGNSTRMVVFETAKESIADLGYWRATCLGQGRLPAVSMRDIKMLLGIQVSWSSMLLLLTKMVSALWDAM